MNRIVEVSQDEVNLYIFGTIGIDNYWTNNTDNTAATFTSDFLYCERKYAKINVIINSLGGYVHEGNAIITLISQSKREVNTFNQGIAASMGAQILMSGQKVFVAKNSMTLFHSPSTIAMGNIEDLKQEIEQLEVITEGFIEVLASKSNKTKDEIRNTFFDCKDHSLSANSMVDLNFAEMSGVQAIFPKNIDQKQANSLESNYSQVAICYQQYDTMNIEEILDINSNNNNQNLEKMNREQIALSLGLAKDATEADIMAKIADNKAKAEAAEAKETQEAAAKAAIEASAGKTPEQIAAETQRATMKSEIKAEIMAELAKPTTTALGVPDGGTTPKSIDLTPASPEALCKANYTPFEY